LIDLTANILIHIIHGDDQIFEMVCCRIQPRIRLSSIHQLIEPIDVVPWGGILLLYAGYINQGILDADGLFKPLQLILIPFGYDLDPAIIQVLNRPLQSQHPGYIRDPGTVSPLMHVARDIGSKPLHQYEDFMLFVYDYIVLPEKSMQSDG
jgi:hypothetical protein